MTATGEIDGLKPFVTIYDKTTANDGNAGAPDSPVDMFDYNEALTDYIRPAGEGQFICHSRASNDLNPGSTSNSPLIKSLANYYDNTSIILVDVNLDSAAPDMVAWYMSCNIGYVPTYDGATGEITVCEDKADHSCINEGKM